MTPYPEDFDYEPVSPFTVVVLNDPFEPMVKRKRSLFKAMGWMFEHAESEARFVGILDGDGNMIYSVQRAEQIVAIEAVWHLLHQVAARPDAPANLPVDTVEAEMHSRVLWPERVGG